MSDLISTATLDAVTGIAVEAGVRVLRVYRSADFGITHKSDHSPLTHADLAAHDYIVAQLARHWPEIPILSEEAADIAYATRREWTRYWLIDPLDGTKEFIKRNGDFTVNIALIENGAPVLGTVHTPALDFTHCGGVGLGAFRIKDGVRSAIHTRTPPAKPCVLVSRSHLEADTDALLARLPAHETKSRGSSLKFCLIADGSADLYPRLGPTSEWDTAAGHAVLEAAGGKMLRLPDLTPLRYNQKDSLLNPGFVAIGDPAFGWERLIAGAD